MSAIYKPFKDLHYSTAFQQDVSYLDQMDASVLSGYRMTGIAYRGSKPEVARKDSQT
jgi:hypothetical protein